MYSYSKLLLLKPLPRLNDTAPYLQWTVLNIDVDLIMLNFEHGDVRFDELQWLSLLPVTRTYIGHFILALL